jgi:hypothetical protein
MAVFFDGLIFLSVKNFDFPLNGKNENFLQPVIPRLARNLIILHTAANITQPFTHIIYLPALLKRRLAKKSV